MNRLLVLASAVLACAMPAEDNTRPPPPSPPPLAPDLPSGGHGPRTLVSGAHNFMDVAAASRCTVCVELRGDSMRAAVTRFNREGSGGRIFARGLRNSVGRAFHPTTGEL